MATTTPPSSPRHPILSYLPLRILTRAVYTTFIVARIPLWLAEAFLPALRPHPKWTAKQTFLRQVAYALCDLKTLVGITDDLSLSPGKEGDRFQVVEPFPSEFYQGRLKSQPSIKPVPVGGTWSPSKPTLKTTSAGNFTVVLYLHGGAFIQGDGRDVYSGFPNQTVPRLGGVDAIFSLDYRLSGYGGQNPFPAALQDALTAYLYLLRTMEIPASQIVLCGDSAGGNLAISFLRYLTEQGGELDIPLPRCVTLLSPWVAPFKWSFSNKTCAQWNSDYLPNRFLRWGAETYGAGVETPEKDEYITPLGNPFPTSCPIFVNVGTQEILLESVREWVGEMKRVDKRNRVELREEEGALHDTFLLADRLGWEESAEGVIKAMGEFVKRRGEVLGE